MMQYGVLPERIHFTGFPLPLENVATAAEDLRHTDLMAPSLHQVQRDLHRQPPLSRCDQATQVPFHLAVDIVVRIAVDVARMEGGCVRDGLARRGDQFVGVVATSNRADSAFARNGFVDSTVGASRRPPAEWSSRWWKFAFV